MLYGYLNLDIPARLRGRPQQPAAGLRTPSARRVLTRWFASLSRMGGRPISGTSMALERHLWDIDGPAGGGRTWCRGSALPGMPAMSGSFLPWITRAAQILNLRAQTGQQRL